MRRGAQRTRTKKKKRKPLPGEKGGLSKKAPIIL